MDGKSKSLESDNSSDAVFHIFGTEAQNTPRVIYICLGRGCATIVTGIDSRGTDDLGEVLHKLLSDRRDV